MLVTLDTGYADTRTDQLSWTLGLDRLEALAARRLRLGDLILELRLLGASHQVLLAAHGGMDGPPAGWSCSETVACLPGSHRPLPSAAATDLDGWRYAFRSRTSRLPSAAFAAAATRLLTVSRGHPAGLAGSYPGSPLAVTAIVAGAGTARPGAGVGWRTWHAYPQTGEILSTETRVTALPQAVEPR